jgi:hypothetical protein
MFETYMCKDKKHRAVIHNTKVSPPLKKGLRYMFRLSCMAAKDKYPDIIQGGSTDLATGRLQNIKTIFPVW